MKIEDYDKYYQNGGSYLIPKEIFEELLEENQKYKEVIDKAREYINKNSVYFAELHKQGNYFINVNADKLLDILKEVE